VGTKKAKKLCGKPMPKAKNGADRGICTVVNLHSRCGNNTCPHCGVTLTENNHWSSQVYKGRRSGMCKSCKLNFQRIKNGSIPKNYQFLGKKHIFPCGCAALLPRTKRSTKYVVYTGSGFVCRISTILKASKASARKRGHTAIPINTSHTAIRELMNNRKCERCARAMSWTIGDVLTTPHLHHDHETGEIYGFTHPKCNPLAMQREIIRLKKLLKEKVA
jgi:NAD-dependent SIR2 family protein deacetylase